MNNKNQQILDTVREFLPWAKEQIGIDFPIKVHLVSKRLNSGAHPSFGGYDLHNKRIVISIKDRHPIDILRTLAHEMTHAKQHSARSMTAADGHTGSDAENEANALAGIVMRNWADYKGQ